MSVLYLHYNAAERGGRVQKLAKSGAHIVVTEPRWPEFFELAKKEKPYAIAVDFSYAPSHALETAETYDLRHGEAVAMGLVFAARLARRLGRIDDAEVAEHERVVASYDLAIEPPPGTDPSRLVEIMRRDKKAIGEGLTFVLDGPFGLEQVRGIPEQTVVDTIRRSPA